MASSVGKLCIFEKQIVKNVRESDKLLSGGEKAVRREDYEAIPGEREDSGQDQKGPGEREDSGQDQKGPAAAVRSRGAIMTMVHLDTGMGDRVYLNQTERPGRVNTGDYDYYIQRAAEGVVHEADRKSTRLNSSHIA